jgi:hypothetical protein
MQLDELSAVLDQLENLLDLFESTPIAMLDVRNEELEQVLAHFVFNDGLAGHFLLLDREPIEDSQTEAEREPEAADLVEFIVLLFKEVDLPSRHVVIHSFADDPWFSLTELGNVDEE